MSAGNTLQNINNYLTLYDEYDNEISSFDKYTKTYTISCLNYIIVRLYLWTE